MAHTNASLKSAADPFPILVHSHLSWDWVWQRPQQFMSRLARCHPILFVETHGPNPDLPVPRASLYKVKAPNVFVLRVQFPTSMWSDGDFVDRERRRLVQEAIDTFLPRFRQPVQWFYDPMAVTAFAGHMNERATVYDCMDELAKFKGAPPNLLDRERELLSKADVVFTGGRKLYESKSQYNGNTWFYGCGVDVDHFSKAALEDTSIAQDILNIPGPKLGYIGVVDERLDYELIDYLARNEPEWQFLIVGPAIKVDPEAFPRHKNLHWLGGRDYEQLPNYAKAFDVCLMPFALNEATEYINPTKTLEYMATQRPIVSTPVADVVSNFSEIVEVASSAESFHTACRTALENRNAARLERGVEMARQNTWEQIVERLEGHVLDVLDKEESTDEAPTLTSLNEGYHQPSLAGKRS